MTKTQQTSGLLTLADLPPGVKLPPMARRGSYGSPYYWIARWYRSVPKHLTRHLFAYRKVGRNLFVVSEDALRMQRKSKEERLLGAKIKLGDLLKKHGAGAELGKVLAAELRSNVGVGSGVTRATPAQVADYEARKARLCAWMVAQALASEKRRQARIERDCQQALETLAKHRRLPAPACNRQHVQDQVD